MKIKLIYVRYMRAPNGEEAHENRKKMFLYLKNEKHISRYARGGQVGAQTELERKQQREKERK